MGSGSRLLAPITGPAQDRARAQGALQTRGRAQPVFLSFTNPRTWIMRVFKPIERLVPVSSTRYRAYTPGLSTWSSSTALKGVLVSRGVSRLDAFSGYPVRT